MIVFKLPASIEQVEISDSVLSVFEGAKQTGTRPEAGGQLFARFERGSVIKIVEATTPSQSDRRGRFWFFPSRLREQKDIWRMHAQGLHYVGDWHTHPQITPSPSSKDAETIADCFKRSRKEIGAFLLIIVGLGPFPTGLYAGYTDGENLRPLEFAQ